MRTRPRLAGLAALILAVPALLFARPPTASEAPLDETTRVIQPLPKLELPAPGPRPPATDLAHRALVLTDVDNELELSRFYARRRFRQVRPLGPFPALVEDTTQRVEETELDWRHRLAKDLDVSVRLPYLSLREAQPTLVPAAAASSSDVLDHTFTAAGLGDAGLRLSKQFGASLHPLRSQAVDLEWKPATGSGDYPAGAALLSPGTGQQDVGIGYRVQAELSGFTASAGVERVLRGSGVRTASDGSSLELKPGDLWRYRVRADRAFRRWLVGSLEVAGFSEERASISGSEVAGSAGDFLAIDPSVTVSLSDDLEVVLSGQLPLAQTNEPSDGVYGFTLRGRF